MWYEASNIPTRFYVASIRKKKGGSAHPSVIFTPFLCYSSSCTPKFQVLFFKFMTSSIIIDPHTHTHTYIQVRKEGERWLLFKLFLFLVAYGCVHLTEGPWRPEGSNLEALTLQAAMSLEMLSLQIFYYFVIVFILLIRCLILSHSACLRC